MIQNIYVYFPFLIFIRSTTFGDGSDRDVGRDKYLYVSNVCLCAHANAV